MKESYQTTIKLKHNEIPAKVNVETGEIKPLVPNQEFEAKKPRDKTMMLFKHTGPFHRKFNKAWMLLESQTTKQELAVANKLAMMAKAYTNSLEPLKPDSSIVEIAETLNENRNTIVKIIDKLFKLGVIGKFEVYNKNEEYQNYWIFNPFLSFNGKAIKHNVDSLFRDTFYAQIGN